MSRIRSLHDSAVKVKPQEPCKPSTIWVAVLHIDKLPDGENASENFLWVKCHGRITAQTIKDQYQNRAVLEEDFVLKHDSKPLASLQVTMSELDTYHDRVIAFEAVKASDTSRFAAPRPPLQPKRNQTLSPSSKQNATAHSGGVAKVKPSKGALTRSPNDENMQIVGDISTRPLHRSSSAAQPNIPPTPTNHKPSVDGKEYGSMLTGLTLPAELQTMSSDEFQSFENTLGHGYGRDHVAGFNHFLGTDGWKLLEIYPHYRGQFEMEHIRHYWDTRKTAERVYYINQAEAMTQTKPSIEEPPISSVELDEQQPKTFQLPSLLKDASPEMLEASVEQGVKLLDQLKAPLLARVENNPDAEQWVQQIDNLRKQAVKTRTIIGVVGNTGAGKSSVINAMLDEERLVPTNCMRACTAVVTEISYNHDDEPYRAQVEFISSAEWEKELKTLFQDLLDGDGQVSRECANEDTDAGIAYAKIKAVYPRKTKNDIANSNVQTMLQEVSTMLGSSKDIKEKDSLVFHKKLQNFVDSREKSTGNKDKDQKKERREMEFWPLIRVVRIYVKSPALATGAVIVDLPGVHDANAARAAVAENYMKECTGLWIVAPINRAVDDKAAKSLLGDSFKRQLKMDGGYHSVTFICSKTDDISREEAQRSLGLEDEMAPDWIELERLGKNRRSMEKRLEDLKDSKAVYGEAVNDVEEQIEAWDSLRDELEEGKTVFPPKPESEGGGNKRKRSGKEQSGRKRSRRSGSIESEDSEFEEKDSEGDEEKETASEAEAERAPLNREQIAAKLQELKSTKKEARSQKAEITEQITALREEINEAEAAEENIESKMSAMCISGRNKYSKGAIQQDFAAGIKELDQELAAEEDEENFDPDAETRDYEEVAKGLPVFCVSSRGYQKLQGRFRKDPDVPGFKSIEETEIPQLQAHCGKLTEVGRTTNCRTFINKLSQLLNSVTLWASTDGTGVNLTADQRAREARYLQKGLETLESGLEKAIKTANAELSEELADNIFDKYDTAISNATNDAIDTTLKWGSPVNRGDRASGGLCWSTYKAICRRNGVYTNGQGPHEWNAQLAEPMLRILAGGWEKTFSRRLPLVMASFSRNSSTALRNFHRDVEARARNLGSNIAGLSMLEHQVSNYENLLKDLSAVVKVTISTAQKDINREFIPVIERAMIIAYEQCVDERGRGSFARMKTHMNSHISQERHVMFQDSADTVQKRLQAMLKDAKELMGERTEEVFAQVRRDYRSIVGGDKASFVEGEMLPRGQRLARRGVMKVIDGVERAFKRVAGVLTEDDQETNAELSDEEEEAELASSAKEEAFDPKSEKISGSEEPSRTLTAQHSPGIISKRAAVKDEPVDDTT